VPWRGRISKDACPGVTIREDMLLDMLADMLQEALNTALGDGFRTSPCSQSIHPW